MSYNALFFDFSIYNKVWYDYYIVMSDEIKSISSLLLLIVYTGQKKLLLLPLYPARIL